MKLRCCHQVFEEEIIYVLTGIVSIIHHVVVFLVLSSHPVTMIHLDCFLLNTQFRNDTTVDPVSA